MNPITIHRKDGDQKTGIMDRLRRRRQIKKLVKKLEKTSDYLERLMIEAQIKDSGGKVRLWKEGN